MRRPLSLLFLTLLVGCASGSSADNGPIGGDDAAVDPETGQPIDTSPPPSELVKNLSISDISLFQGSKLTLEKDGAPTTTGRRNIVAGRAGRLRVYVNPLDGWSTRDVVGVLTITSGSGTVTTLTDTKTIEGASSDRSTDSTINFDVDTGIIDLGATYNVSLRTGPGQPDGPSDGARYPAGDASEAFNAQDAGESFKIVLVPWVMNGYTPDLSDEAIEKWRSTLYAYYPVKQVELTVHDPVVSTASVSATSSSSWSAILNKTLQLRASEGKGDDVFYYGIFTPSKSFESFCAVGCIGGIAPFTFSASDTYTRGGVGLGWPSTFGMMTMAQELAHSLGRQHAPCSPPGQPLPPQLDPSFPYKDGSVGVWGWNLVDKILVPPTSHDFMGYCDPPAWTSDYTFGGILTRIAYIAKNGSIKVPKGAPLDYRSVDVAPDGHMTWGDPVHLSMPPLSEPHTITYKDKDGHVLQSATGHFYPYDAFGGGLLLVPEGPSGFVTMRVDQLGGVDRFLAR
jgi:hypothetical protein